MVKIPSPSDAFTFEDKPLSDGYAVLKRDIPQEYIFLLEISDLKLQDQFRLSSLTFVICNNVRKLTLYQLVEFVDLSLVQHWCPHLKELVIMDSTMKQHQISDVNMTDLESLTYTNYASPGLTITQSHFPNLIHFSVTNHSSQLANSFQISFTAPNLKHFSVQGFHIPHLVITKYPLIESLIATDGIQRLTMENCTRLAHLDISHNRQMYYLKTEPLTSLKNLKYEETHYMFRVPSYESSLSQTKGPLRRIQEKRCQMSVFDPGRTSGPFSK